MKKIVYILLIFVILSGCVSDTTNINDIEFVTVSVDKRIELLFVLQYLSNFETKDIIIENRVNNYTKDIDKYFLSYKNHEAVKLCEALSDSGFTYGIPFSFFVNFNDDFTLKNGTIEKTFSIDFIEQCGGLKNLKSFVKAIKSFYNDTNFDMFFNNNQTYYNSLLPNAKTIKEINSRVEKMINHFGYMQNSYNIIIADHYKTIWYGPRSANENSLFDTYCIATNASEINKNLNLITHEFTHSYVNHLTEKYYEKVADTELLLSLHLNSRLNNTYNSWYSIVNEYIVRANVIKLSNKSFILPALKIDKLKSQEKENGFIYINDIYKKIIEYSDNREIFSNFDDFYLEIIDEFNRITREESSELSFKGKLSSIYSTSNLTVIVPTQEQTKEQNQSVYDYALAMGESRPNSGIKILTDVQALQADLSNTSIVALGTMWGNLWLKEISLELPFEISNDKLIADESYDGTDMSLATVYQNNDNDKYAVFIFTGQKPEDSLTLFNKINQYKEKDFVIFDGDKTVSSGIYDKSETPWKFN